MAPTEVRRYTTNYGRSLVYYLDRGRHFTQDKITKFLEIPSKKESGKIMRLPLPAGWINEYHQYQRRARNRPKLGNILRRAIPVDTFGEEEMGFAMLYRNEKQDVFPNGRASGNMGIELTNGKGDDINGTSNVDALDRIIHAVLAGTTTSRNSTQDDSLHGAHVKDTKIENQNIEIPSVSTQPVMIDDSSPLTKPSSPPSKPSKLLALPWGLRRRILRRALEIHRSKSVIYLDDLATLPALLRASKKIRTESQGLLSLQPLVIKTALRPDVTVENQWRRQNTQLIYSDGVPELRLTAEVIHHFEAESLEGVTDGILDTQGVHLGSDLIVPRFNAEGEMVAEMNIMRTPVLARNIAIEDAQKYPGDTSKVGRRYKATFALTNHAYLFGWQRYCGFDIGDLTINVIGAMRWSNIRFAPPVQHYRVLPIVALIAALIANRPIWLEKVTILGLAVYDDMFTKMWDAIPDSTPITGRHWLLDLLVAYPFADFGRADGGKKGVGLSDIEKVYWNSDGIVEGGMKTRAREGNMWGLRTEMQWQTMIMKERRGKNQAVWRFCA